MCYVVPCSTCNSDRRQRSIVHLFLLPLPPPQRSTLFPYTTLFRSSDAADDRHHEPDHRARVQHHHGSPRHFRNGDRKSTRLNSSHGYISYAVFCLKKKTGAHVLVLSDPAAQPRVLVLDARCRRAVV